LRSSYADIGKELLVEFPDYQKTSFKVSKLAHNYIIAIENSKMLSNPDFNKIGTSISSLINFLLKKQ